MRRHAPWLVAAILFVAGCGSTGHHVSPSPTTVMTTTTPRPPVTLGPPTVITIGSCHLIDGKADRRCTPGAINPLVLQDAATHYSHTICAPVVPGQVSWIHAQRPPLSYTNSIKALQIPEYGLGDRPPAQAQMAAVEEDHFFPLEAGGAPRDANNLWPEPWNGSVGAHAKDQDENYEHRQICGPARWTVEQAFAYNRDKWSHD